MDSVYIEYTAFVNDIISRNDLSNFKNDSRYKVILEHVTPIIGEQLYNAAITEFNVSEDDARQYVLANDMYGNPSKSMIKGIHASPSSFRYIYHSLLALKHISSLNFNQPIDIVEIGGGYGGLCLAVSYFAKLYNIEINTYHLIDIDPIHRLQQEYLNKHLPLKNINNIAIYNADNYGKDVSSNERPLYLISNYAFAEINEFYQNKYLEFLFPKVTNGFILWNNSVKCNINREYTQERERPNDIFNNGFIYF